MKIVFASNYYNHHQHALSMALNQKTNGNYFFIATSEMREERRALGYGMDVIPDFVKNAYESEAERKVCMELIESADVLIAGEVPEKILAGRIRAGKLIFRYTERPLKFGIQPEKYLLRFIRWHLRNPVWKPIYLLCAGAYTASDYASFGLFRGRSYQWGYFPERKYYEINDLIRRKKSDSILWVGRFLNWKHPDDALVATKRLKDEGYIFQLTFVGMGPLEKLLKQRVQEWDMTQCVSFSGSMKPEQVRSCMEESEILLFTSDRREGWGAVVNEAMNSGCAVLASDAAGSVPYLVRDGANGLVYSSGAVDELYGKLKYLLDHPQQRALMGEKAYTTIIEVWNAYVAAERLLTLVEKILQGEKHPDLFDSGPCSRA